MSGSPHAHVTSVTLRALEGLPLKDQRIRDMVVATAESLAERNAVEVLDVHTEPDHITVTLAANRLVAIGFAAELRRLTTRWYTKKFGVSTLWGEPPEESSDQDDDEPRWLDS
jgi:hypothetical protein